MSEHNRISKIFFIFTAALLFAVLIIACGEDGVSSRLEFKPGTYIGTYRIQLSAYATPIVDTVEIDFRPNHEFRMTWLETLIVIDNDSFIDSDREFCDVFGEYEVIDYNDRIKIIISDSNLTRMTCNPSYAPTDSFSRQYLSNDIVFFGESDNFDKRIYLWEYLE